MLPCRAHLPLSSLFALVMLTIAAARPTSAQVLLPLPGGGGATPMCSGCGQIYIEPSPATVVRLPNTSGHNATYTVSNTYSQAMFVDFTCVSTGNVTCGTPNPNYAYIGAGSWTTVTIEGYSVGAAGSASVRLKGVSDGPPVVQSTGIQTVQITSPTYTVAVTPDAQAKEVSANTSSLTEVYTVTNNGNSAATYNLSCSKTGSVASCSVQGTVGPIQPTLSQQVTVTYATGSAGSGTLQLTASYGGYSNDGSYNITAATYSASVTPALDPQQLLVRLIETSGLSEPFIVTNTGTTTRSFTLTCEGLNGITCTQPNPAVRTLGPSQADTVSITYSTWETPYVGTLKLTASASSPTTTASGGYYINMTEPLPPAAQILSNTFSPAARLPETGPYTYTLTVQNEGALGATFYALCTSTPQLPCTTPSPASFYLAGGATQTVTVGYNTMGLGTSTSASSSGPVNLTISTSATP